jgi:hypothetical protein
MQAKDMPYGTTIGDYEIVRRKREAHDQVGHTVGGHSEPVYGARSSLYLGGFVADDEEVIDFPTVTKLRNAPGRGRDQRVHHRGHRGPVRIPAHRDLAHHRALASRPGGSCRGGARLRL